LGPVLLVCAAVFCAHAQDAPEVTRARTEIEKLRSLVAAGAAPRLQLEQAEAKMVDAEDADFLRKTLYGQDLTAEQADEMIAAATRRLDRRREALEAAQKLVTAKVAPQMSLELPQNDLEMAQKELNLAESRANLTRELAEMARAEEDVDTKPEVVTERFSGDGIFNPVQLTKIESAFESHFRKSLPISALGETAVHRALGFDHRGRVDVALYPDAPEGVWLRDYLTRNGIPFFAFRHAVPGKATGAHIHIGPGSSRIRNGG